MVNSCADIDAKCLHTSAECTRDKANKVMARALGTLSIHILGQFALQRWLPDPTCIAFTCS